jgi:translocation and assembly module TamA
MRRPCPGLRLSGPTQARVPCLGRGRRVALALLAAWPALSGGQQAPESATPAPPAFLLEIEAPPAERQLLADHLSLPRYSAVPDLDETELDRVLVLADREIRELLATRGYFTPRVHLRRHGTQRPTRVQVQVDPGPPTRVVQVHLALIGPVTAGTDALDRALAARLAREWGLPAGQVFTQEGWDAAKAAAVARLQARRYPAARVADSRAEVDAPAAQARLGLRLDSGPPVRLGPMAITGLRHHPPWLVERFARLPPGSDYDRQRLEEAQQRLTDSGYFDSAFVHVDPDSDPRAAPVQVQVREAPLQRVVLGLGVSTDDGPRASLEHRHLQVPGLRWRADSRLHLQARAPAVDTEWTGLPDARGWRLGVLARAERQRDGGQVIDAQRLRLGRTQSVGQIDRQWSVQWDRADVSSAGALALQDRGDGDAVAAQFGWTLRAFEPAAAPRQGQGLALEVGTGWTLAAPRTPFQRAAARGLWLQPLASGRIQWRAQAGAVLARATARVPATQLFRTGGDTSVRGYGLRDIGARQSDGTVGPGRLLAVASAEWQWPIRRSGGTARWEAAAFIDSGAVADRLREMAWHTGFGLGLRYASPVGPLRVDLAWGQRTQRLRLHLSVGVVW